MVEGRSADQNLPPHPILSPANPAARGGGEGTNESSDRHVLPFFIFNLLRLAIFVMYFARQSTFSAPGLERSMGFALKIILQP